VEKSLLKCRHKAHSSLVNTGIAPQTCSKQWTAFPDKIPSPPTSPRDFVNSPTFRGFPDKWLACGHDNRSWQWCGLSSVCMWCGAQSRKLVVEQGVIAARRTCALFPEPLANTLQPQSHDWHTGCYTGQFVTSDCVPSSKTAAHRTLCDTVLFLALGAYNLLTLMAYNSMTVPITQTVSILYSLYTYTYTCLMALFLGLPG